MNYKFIDTNIFVEIFARNGIKSDKSSKLIQEESELYTTSLVVSEVEWVLRTACLLSREKIVIYLKKILASNIEIENKHLILKAVSFYEKNNVDWTDCLNMFSIKRKGIEIVYSYDKGLDKFDWIKRLEP